MRISVNRKLHLFRATTTLLFGLWMFAAAYAQTPFEEWANSACAQSSLSEPRPTRDPFGLETVPLQSGDPLPQQLRCSDCRWVDISGRTVLTSSPSLTVAPLLAPGRYFLTEAGAVVGSIQLLPLSPSP